MSEVTMYKKQIAYSYLLAIRIAKLLDYLDNVEEIVYDNEGTREQLYMYKICLMTRTLYVILPPSVKKELEAEYNRFIDKCSKDPEELIEAVILFIDAVINSLDKHNLLIRSKRVPTGGDVSSSDMLY